MLDNYSGIWYMDMVAAMREVYEKIGKFIFFQLN